MNARAAEQAWRNQSMKLILFAAAALVGPASSASAAESTVCAEDAVTNAHFCFVRSEVRDVGGIRSAPFYSGGPDMVDRTGYTIAANCSSGVMHLKDRRGVSFAGATPTTGTRQSRDLLRLLCIATVKARK